MRFIFCKSWCPLRVCFESTFINHGNGCSDRRCEGWFINGVLCGESLNEVMDKYGRWKNAVEGKGLRVNVDRAKGMQLLFGKKSSVSKVRKLVAIPLSVRNVRHGFIIVVVMCLGRWVYYLVRMSSSVE